MKAIEKFPHAIMPVLVAREVHRQNKRADLIKEFDEFLSWLGTEIKEKEKAKCKTTETDS